MNTFRDLICHGERDRCLTLYGRKLPVCSRCTGFYSGMAAGLIFYFLFFNWGAFTLFVLSVMSLIPMAVDGLLQGSTSYESTNTIRLLTGLIAGSFIGMDLGWILVQV